MQNRWNEKYNRRIALSGIQSVLQNSYAFAPQWSKYMLRISIPFHWKCWNLTLTFRFNAQGMSTFVVDISFDAIFESSIEGDVSTLMGMIRGFWRSVCIGICPLSCKFKSANSTYSFHIVIRSCKVVMFIIVSVCLIAGARVDHDYLVPAWLKQGS